MATIINASNGSTSGLIQTGDASGILQLQTNNGTPALTLNTAQALGVGSSPAYGTAGQVLTSGGSGAAPSWTTPSAGAMTLINTQTASNSSTIQWTNLNYSKLIIFVESAFLSNNSVNLQLQIGSGNITWSTSYYFFGGNSSGVGTGGSSFNNAIYSSGISGSGSSFIPIAPFTLSYSNLYSYGVSAYIVIENATNDFPSFNIMSNNYRVDGNGAIESIAMNASAQIGGGISGIKLYPTSGTISNGKFSIYGLAS